MLREDYLKERSDELRHIENRSSAIFGDDPYITLKISSAQGTTSSKFLRTTRISDVVAGLTISIPAGGHPDGRLYLEGELLNPSFRICDFNIEDNDILELH